MRSLIVLLLVVLLGLQRFQEAQTFHVFQASQASKWSSRKIDSFRFTNVDRIASKCKVLNQVTNEIVGQSTESLPRLRVVLDLDETMVHTIFRAPNWDSRYEIRNIKFNWCGDILSQWMITRPKLNETLEMLSQHADLYIYSAGANPYVEAAAKSLDPASKFFKKIFGRSHLVDFNDEGEAVGVGDDKDIRIIEPDFLETRTVLIDNARYNLVHRPQNGLHLPDFYGDKPSSSEISRIEDEEDLHKLAILIVEKLVPAPDIRPLIQDYKITIPAVAKE